MPAASSSGDPQRITTPKGQSAASLLAGLGALFVVGLVLTAGLVVSARRDGRIRDAATEPRTLDLLLAGETDQSFQSVRLVLDGVAAQL